ncbi:MAG: spore protease YyaC [Betaproteobacteria bacterium]
MGFFGGNREAVCRAHVDDPDAPTVLASSLRALFSRDLPDPARRPLLFFCIGTDRSTGDSLGPLTGTRLVSLGIDSCRVWGTLDNPVHAANLQDSIDKALAAFGNPYIVAVDACLGRLENVGTITANRGPLRPGTGVSKTLPQVGHAHITGIVNVGGYMEYMVLQNTRLHLVIRMAEVIGTALASAARDLLGASPALEIAHGVAATRWDSRT